MAQAKERIECSNCGEPFHGLTACKPTEPTIRESLRKSLRVAMEAFNAAPSLSKDEHRAAKLIEKALHPEWEPTAREVAE